MILGDPLGLGAGVAILVSLVGVMAISLATTDIRARSLLTSLTEKTALIGIASGAYFGISAVVYRGASLSLGGEGFLMQAAFTLACVTVFQTLVMAIYMRLREPGQITRVIQAWRVAGWVGLSGMMGSAGWFTAMTIQTPPMCARSARSNWCSPSPRPTSSSTSGPTGSSCSASPW